MAHKQTRKPTREQEAAIQAFLAGHNLKINAYAGTGKTSTLEMLAHATNRKGQYIAFNKKIVEEAKDRFPERINCATSHGLAYRGMMKKYGNDKLVGKINPKCLVELMGFKEKVELDSSHRLSPDAFASLCLRTINNYCNSASREIVAAHIPESGYLSMCNVRRRKKLQEKILENVTKIWGRMIDPGDVIPLGFGGYLKLWSLGAPQIDADYILLDEAQDTNGPILDVLSRQKAQVVYVGDRYQQIYEWRGAINAMDAVKTQAHERLTQSFRFGWEIAQFASSILECLAEQHPVIGNPNARGGGLVDTTPEVILTRTNAKAIEAIIDCMAEGKRPWFVGGGQELKQMIYGVFDLMKGNPSVVPEFFGFKNWKEVIEYADTEEGIYLYNFVQLVLNEGASRILDALNRMAATQRANIIVSTAHKAKGLEWNRVELKDDFLLMEKKEDSRGKEFKLLHESELNLFYVAVTRAKQDLMISEEMMETFESVANPYGDIRIGSSF